ncbi:IS3 family transposase, partial [Bacillus cereus]|nr:IS3 family transposase [Bacillus cereus]
YNLKPFFFFFLFYVYFNKYLKFYYNYRYQWNLKKMTPVGYRNHLLDVA